MNVLGWIAGQHPSLPKPAVAGWSRGGAISMMAAQMAPARVSALVLFGFLFDPEAQFVDVTVTAKPAMEKNTAEAAASDFISPAVTPPAVIRAFVEQALKADPVRIDLKNDGEFNFLKPDRMTVPTLILYGQQDPGVSDTDAGKFFAKLAAVHREMVVLPGADHAAHLEDTHEMWISAIVTFLNRPPVRR
jgi:pimeloyl-ACP methyl ester carboxylesterase